MNYAISKVIKANPRHLSVFSLFLSLSPSIPPSFCLPAFRIRVHFLAFTTPKFCFIQTHHEILFFSVSLAAKERATPQASATVELNIPPHVTLL